MLDKPDMRETTQEVRIKSKAIFSCRPCHMDEQRQDDQQEPIYNSSVLILDRALKTSQERWMIEMGGKRGSGRSMLAARHNDDDDENFSSIYLLMHKRKRECIFFFKFRISLQQAYLNGTRFWVFQHFLYNPLINFINCSFDLFLPLHINKKI